MQSIRRRFLVEREGTGRSALRLHFRGSQCHDIICVMELTALQMETIERLFEAGFRPIAIAPYENALCVHRGEYAAVLAPVANGGLRLLAPVTVMVEGNLSVRLKKKNGDVFVWKGKEVAATEEMLRELGKFREELEGILESRKL